MDDRFKYNNILKFKDFDHLQYTEFLKKEFIPYIKNWISIEQTEQYKEFVLEFLRSFMATLRANRKFVTHNSEELANHKRHDKFSKHAVFGNNGNLPRQEYRPPTIDEIQAKINELDKNSVKFEESLNREDISNRKKELIAGAKNILKGIYSGNTTSVYSETHKGLQPKHHIKFKPDFYTSGIKGVMPDTRIKNEIKENHEISDELKSRVQSLLFFEK